MPPKPRLALVIGSGAVKCAAALGAWRALQRAGLQLDLLVGCSGGSLFAASMALGWALDDCVENTRALWNPRVTQKRHWPSLARAAFPALFKFDERFGLVDDGYLRGALNAVFGELTFADVQTPLHVVATDFASGEAVVLSDGRLADALRASVAIPFIWAPWRVNGRLLIDGSVANPMPLDVAMREGAETILALGFASPLPRQVKSISRFVFHINGIMTNNLFKANYSFHNLAHHAEIVSILPEFDRPVRLFDTGLIPYVIERGEQAMEASLPYLRQLLAAEGH